MRIYRHADLPPCGFTAMRIYRHVDLHTTVGVQQQLMVTEKQVAVNKHHRETVLADTRKAAERQQQEYSLLARRRRLTITAVNLPTPGSDQRHQQLLQQILKYEAVLDSLKLATHSHDRHVSINRTYLLLLLLLLLAAASTDTVDR